MTDDDSTRTRQERKIDELHSDVVGVRIALAELTAEVKASNAAQAVRDASVTDHELRLRKLEQRTPDDLPKQLEDSKRFRWTLIGSALAGGSALGGVAGAIVKAL